MDIANNQIQEAKYLQNQIVFYQEHLDKGIGIQIHPHLERYLN